MSDSIRFGKPRRYGAHDNRTKVFRGDEQIGVLFGTYNPERADAGHAAGREGYWIDYHYRPADAGRWGETWPTLNQAKAALEAHYEGVERGEIPLTKQETLL